MCPPFVVKYNSVRSSPPSHITCMLYLIAFYACLQIYKGSSVALSCCAPLHLIYGISDGSQKALHRLLNSSCVMKHVIEAKAPGNLHHFSTAAQASRPDAEWRAMQVPGFNEGKWIAVGDEEGFVSIVNGAAALPKAFRPGNPDESRPQAQWLAHHNAIFDLAWCQVTELTQTSWTCVVQVLEVHTPRP